ncbi:B3 domain-containing protein os06g0194400 [Phtheirospermum japonicum]|uniref:B3 domain-containing protein os06g0194400 n=1 Tax=Phtheirospermum japonicum TaxID=374723 RepID=A0A830D0E0_9LAMI|nr:B3 domain-containing protein os06g0194400 [Phtheirospermum japonicum]
MSICRRMTEVVLEDENEIEHPTNYLANRNALSGGWKAFAIAHKLVEEDVCVFELVNQCNFKVKSQCFLHSC